jgi:hypothetical protein
MEMSIMQNKLCNDRLQELKDLAKLLAVEGVRNNTDLEMLHGGVAPSSKTGDFSDVKVISPFGEIDWNRISRINDEEMRMLMLSIGRALEMTLIAYETLDDADKKTLLKAMDNRRSYDPESRIICTQNVKIAKKGCFKHYKRQYLCGFKACILFEYILL